MVFYPYIQEQDSKVMTSKSSQLNVTSKVIQISNNHV